MPGFGLVTDHTQILFAHPRCLSTRGRAFAPLIEHRSLLSSVRPLARGRSRRDLPLPAHGRASMTRCASGDRGRRTLERDGLWERGLGSALIDRAVFAYSLGA